MAGDKVVGYCQTACSWSVEVTEPESGQTLFGTLGDLMARHEGKTGHKKHGIDWDKTVLSGDVGDE